jgi:hypothetical protein
MRLIPDANALMDETATRIDELRAERDSARRNAADLSEALREEQERSAELLEALTALVLYHDVPAEAQDPVAVPLLRAALAAIAKAEGRS